MMTKTSAVLLVALSVVYCGARPDQYTNKYDNVDIDEILHSDRLLSNYMKCLLDTGRCTPEGQELRKVLPDALENGCSKCSEKQKDVGKKVLKFLIEERRSYYDQLEAKYDPEGKYRKQYDEEIKKEGLKL